MYKEGSHAKKIIEAQEASGLWGFFHTLSVPDGKPLTTEQALRRLEVLGVTKEDQVIRKTLDYMEACLKGQKVMVDRREKSHNWDLFTELMLGTWLLRYDPQHHLGLEVAKKWAQVVKGGFQGESFNQDAYNEAYMDVFGEKIYGGIFMDPANFYHVSLLKGQLDETVEAKYVDYLVNHPQGIYYIGYPGRLKDLPEVFNSRQTIRFLASVRMLAEYESYKKYGQPVIQWLENNRDPEGNWTFDTRAKDNIYLPLSDSWRKAETRIADSTAFVKSCILPLA